MNNTNIKNVALKFAILLILEYNIFGFKINIQIKSSSVDIMSYLVVAIVD